ncbi:MAG: 16S rRNA (guanine966-N2)-methyltransferase [Planctomycetota bacterium]|jgi:16S rRNA (guanine966-N2)-methyltransferase
MRIIAGDAKGRKLLAPPGRDTRPFLDSLKEALFNILQGEIEDAAVWDLFSGSGSMGLEALSRGAKHAAFVDKGRSAIDTLRKNIDALGYGDRCRVSSLDVFRYERHTDDPCPDIIFFDPPFPLVQQDPDRILRFLPELAENLNPSGLLMYRSPAKQALSEVGEGLILEDCRVKGVNALHFIRVQETFE